MTSNIPIDGSGSPVPTDAKVLTTEHNFRLTPTEKEYFVIRKMKEEQRLRGNQDLEDHLKSVDEEFDIVQKTLANEDIEDIIKEENSNSDSLDSLDSLD